MGILKSSPYVITLTKDTTNVPNLEVGVLSDLSRESREECVWLITWSGKIDVKDIEMASVFTQANYMCNEWLMNHY